MCKNCGVTIVICIRRGTKCGNCGEELAGARSARRRAFFKQFFGFLGSSHRNREKVDKYPIPAATLPKSDLQLKIEKLARKAWGGRDDIVATSLTLPVNMVLRLSSHSDMLKEMLRHVHKVAPALSVPMLTPRIVIEPMSIAAGQFVEQDGWVKIGVRRLRTITATFCLPAGCSASSRSGTSDSLIVRSVLSTNFFSKPQAGIAILCHELCHYILGSNGIREKPTIENERLTDAAMFVFGLGELFMAGYKQVPNSEYRSGHRLGYLTDEEYAATARHVLSLRKSEEFLKTAKPPRDTWNWDRSLR
jgi:hypothetical protein